MTDRLFSTNEVCEISGATARMTQFWDEKRLIRPARDGRCRYYSPYQALQVAVLADLRQKGITLAQARRLLRAPALANTLPEWVTAGLSYDGFWYGTDGWRGYVEVDAQRCLRLLAQSLRPVVVIDVAAHWRRVQAAAHVPRAA